MHNEEREKRTIASPVFFMCAGHGTILAGESPATGIYRQVETPEDHLQEPAKAESLWKMQLLRRGHFQGSKFPVRMVQAVRNECGQFRLESEDSRPQNKGSTWLGRSLGVLSRRTGLISCIDVAPYTRPVRTVQWEGGASTPLYPIESHIVKRSKRKTLAIYQQYDILWIETNREVHFSEYQTIYGTAE